MGSPPCVDRRAALTPTAGYKREIVGKFLTETVTWEMVPRKKNEICKEMVGACSHRPPISTPGSDCARCKAAMASLEFDIRTQGDVRAAKGVARQVRGLCMSPHCAAILCAAAEH